MLGYDTSLSIWVSVPKGVDLHVLTLGMLKFLIRICSSLDLASGYFDSLLLHFFRPWLISKNKNKENAICPKRCLSESGSPLGVMLLRTDHAITASTEYTWSRMKSQGFWNHKGFKITRDFKMELHSLGLRTKLTWGWLQLSLQRPSGSSGSITTGEKNGIWSLFTKVSHCDHYFPRSPPQCHVQFRMYEFTLVQIRTNQINFLNLQLQRKEISWNDGDAFCQSPHLLIKEMS